MKKVVSLLLVLSLVMLLFSACSQETDSGSRKKSNRVTTTGNNSDQWSDKWGSDDSPQTEYLEKIDATSFVAATNFVNGRAAVAKSKAGPVYIIDKKGNILYEFDLPGEKISLLTEMGQFFLVNQSGRIGLINQEGKLVWDEDIGVSTFYGVAAEDGYILAEQVVATFDSTTRKLGVLDKNFNWIVEPTEEMYEQIPLNNYIYSDYYYHKEYLYRKENNNFLNILTGEVVEYCDVDFEHPSTSWTWTYDKTIVDPSNNVKIDLSQYANPYHRSVFKDGLSFIAFANGELETYFFTLLKEDGTFAFEPIDICANNISWFDYDSNVIVVEGDWSDKIKSFDTTGKLLGEIDTQKAYNSNGSRGIDVGDGVVKIAIELDKIVYYTPELTPLW